MDNKKNILSEINRSQEIMGVGIKNIKEQKDTRENTITGGEWTAIMGLWDELPELRDKLVNKINEGINDDAPYGGELLSRSFSLTGPDAYASVRPYLNSVTINTLKQGSGDWMKATGTFTGEAYLYAKYGKIGNGTDANLTGEVSISFKIVEGKLIYSVDSFNASTTRYLWFVPLWLRFKNNNIILELNALLYNDEWEWDSGVESVIKKEFKNKEIDIIDWLENLKK